MRGTWPSSRSTTCPTAPVPRPAPSATFAESWKRWTPEEGVGVGEKRIGLIMHGVTGRMGMNQHLVRSILEIRRQGGVALKDGTRLMPDPVLVGRNAGKLQALARKHGVRRWTTDLDQALLSKDEIFFDAASTQLRPKLLKQA